MTDLKTDAEKAEEIKQWWKENGTSVITGVAIAIAGVFGWQQWQAHKVTQTEEASALFSKIKTEDMKEANKAGTDALAKLKADSSSSPYAALGALHAAKQASNQGKDDQAKAELQWTIDNTTDSLIKQVAQLQLARLEISTKHYDNADALLNNPFDEAYSSLVKELKGDVFREQNKLDDAVKAYNEAIQLSEGNPPRYLQMKLDSIYQPKNQSTNQAGNGA